MTVESLSTLRDAVYDRVDVDPSDPRVPATTVNRALNAALRMCSTDFDPFWLQTSASLNTVAATGSYVLTGLANFSKLSRIQDSDSYDMEFIGPKEIAYRQRGSQGQPHSYTIEENSIKLAPIPDRVYTLTCIYYRIETGLTSDSDTPLLPVQYSDYLVVRASLIIAKKLKDSERVQQLNGDLKDWIERINDDIRQVRAMPRIRVREEWNL